MSDTILVYEKTCGLLESAILAWPVSFKLQVARKILVLNVECLQLKERGGLVEGQVAGTLQHRTKE